MTDTIRYVNTDNSSSGDGTTNEEDGSADSAYISLSAWEAAEQGTIGANDRHLVYCCGATDDGSLLISGWTVTDAEALQVIANRDHPEGFNDGGLVWDAGRHLTTHTSGFYSIRIDSGNVVLDGLQIESNRNNANVETVNCVAIVTVKNCRIQASGLTIAALVYSNTSTAGANANVSNCILFNANGDGIAGASSSGTHTYNWYNNTIFDVTTGINAESDVATFTHNIYNNCIYNVTNYTNHTGSTGTINEDYYAYDGGIAPAGSNNVNMTATVTDEMEDPENATMLSRDVRPIWDGSLVGAGRRDDANAPTTDLYGGARTGTGSTIGAVEYLPSRVDDEIVFPALSGMLQYQRLGPEDVIPTLAGMVHGDILADLQGDATASIDEDDITTGGKVLTIYLKNDSWVND